jgi:hypothetical protein
MAISVAYWINPYGKILDISNSKHITQVIRQPEKFGIRKDDVISTYKKYGEPVGVEGKAREELMLKILDKGFIRIRLYPNKYWSVNVKRWDRRTKKALSKWAEKAKDDKFAGKYMDVKIVTDNSVISDYNVNDLYLEKHLFEGEEFFEKWFKPEFVDGIDSFSELDIQRLIRL